MKWDDDGLKADVLEIIIVSIMVILFVVVTTLLISTKTAKADTLPIGTVSHLAYEASQRHGMPASAADRLVCIAWYESRFDSQAVSSGGWYYGMMQFGQHLWMTQAPALGYNPYLLSAYDPYAAMDVAAYVASRGGWRNWSPVNDGRC